MHEGVHNETPTDIENLIKDLEYLASLFGMKFIVDPEKVRNRTMTDDIVDRLRATKWDKDNMPRLPQEKWLPIGLAYVAAEEIERLRHVVSGDTTLLQLNHKEIERLRSNYKALAQHHNEHCTCREIY